MSASVELTKLYDAVMSVWKLPFVVSVTSTPNIWVSLAMSAVTLAPC